jgi:hypothetical protein
MIRNVERLARSSDKPNKLLGHDAISEYVDNWTVQGSALAHTERTAELFAEVFSSWAGSRRLFSTSMGHLGLGSEAIQEGDQVWVTPKAHVPFILRRVPHLEQENIFIFVGECYIHGIMHGEFFKTNDPPLKYVVLV